MKKNVDSLKEPEKISAILDFFISFIFENLDQFTQIEQFLKIIQQAMLKEGLFFPVFIINDQFSLYDLKNETIIRFNRSVLEPQYIQTMLQEISDLINSEKQLLLIGNSNSVKAYFFVDPEQFDQGQLLAINFISKQLNHFLERQKSLSEKYISDLEQRVQTMTKLNSFSLILNSVYTDEIITLQQVADFCGNIFQAEQAGLFLISQNSEEFEIVSGWDKFNDFTDWVGLKFASESPLGIVFNQFLQRKKIAYLHDVISEKNIVESLGEFSRILNIDNTILLPLFIMNNFFGFLALKNASISQDIGEIEDLSLTIAHMLSSSLHNASLYKNNIEIKHYLANLIRNSRDAIVSLDLNGKIILWNDGAKNIFGWEEQEIIGKNFFYLFSSESRSKITGEWIEVLTGRIILAEEATGLKKDSGKISLSYTFSPIKDKENKIVGLSIIFRDLTEKKKLEKDISESKNRLQTIFDNLNDQIILFNLEHKITMANKVAFKFCNQGPRSIIGSKNYRLIEGINFNGLSIIEKTIKNRKSCQIDDYLFENQVFNLKTLPVFDSLGNLTSVILHARDLTEEKTFQKKLSETEKMAVIGNITGGIAYEFSVPLSIIIGCTEELKEILSGQPQGNFYTEKILDNVRKISSFIDNLSRLVYDETIPEEKIVIDIYFLLNELITLIERAFSSQGITFRLASTNEIFNVYGYYHHLQKAFLNIFTSVLNPFGIAKMQKFSFTGEICVYTNLHEEDDKSFLKISFCWAGSFAKSSESDLAVFLENDLAPAVSIISDHQGFIEIEEKDNFTVNVFLPVFD